MLHNPVSFYKSNITFYILFISAWILLSIWFSFFIFHFDLYQCLQTLVQRESRLSLNSLVSEPLSVVIVTGWEMKTLAATTAPGPNPSPRPLRKPQNTPTSRHGNSTLFLQLENLRAIQAVAMYLPCLEIIIYIKVGFDTIYRRLGISVL